MSCNYWIDYCEPDIGLEEYCKIMKIKNPPCNCGQKNKCPYPDKYKENYE